MWLAVSSRHFTYYKVPYSRYSKFNWAIIQKIITLKKIVFKSGDKTAINSSTTAKADGNISTIFLPGGLRSLIS
jgi:hypothetical protein